MTTKELGTVDRNANETALREVWYGRVLAEQGRGIPIKVDLTVQHRDLIEPHGRTKFLPRRSLRSRLEINMATWKLLHGTAKSELEIDLDTIEFTTTERKRV